MTKKYNYIFLSILFTYILIFILIFLYFFKLKDYFSIPTCPIYNHLGLFCPACGGTRALISLLKLDLLSSILYNPIVVYTIFFTTLYLITEFLNVNFNKKISINFKPILKTGIFILFANCILKNIFILSNKF